MNSSEVHRGNPPPQKKQALEKGKKRTKKGKIGRKQRRQKLQKIRRENGKKRNW